jgi:hypothetical protein
MKISEVKIKLNQEESLVAEIMRNPDDLKEWVIWIRDSMGKSYLLFTNELILIRSVDVNSLLHLLKSIGFKQSSVIL